MSKSFSNKQIKNDLTSGLVVFLVAIPLCLGIALASNAPLFSGLLAGIIGGVVVGTLSQSHVSVSGPAAGMIAIVLACIADIGSFNGLLTALVIAGLLQIMIGKLKAGFIADYVPTAVIHGLLAAIGILIVIKQIPFAVGYFAKGNMLLEEVKLSDETLNFSPLFYFKTHLSLGAMLITGLSLLILGLWHKVPSQKLKLIPAPVIVVLLGIAANAAFREFLPFLHLAHAHYLVTIPSITSLSHLKPHMNFPDFSLLANFKIYYYAMFIAVIGSIETLLNLEAAEKIDSKKRYCSRNKELVAQGVGNTISGFLGGLPITSVIVRSSVNVQSGAETKLSAIFHGLLILMAVLLIPNWLNAIPLASLAAILIFVGLKLASPKAFFTMYKKGMSTFIPFVVTTSVIIMTDLLTGVLSGLLICLLWIMKESTKSGFNLKKEQYPCSEVIRLKLPEQMTFLNKAAFIQELRQLPDNANVILDARYTRHMDFDILEAIEEFTKNLSYEKNISLRLEGFKEGLPVSTREDFVNVTTLKVQKSLSAERVLQLLEQGNERFIKSQPIHRNLNQQVSLTSSAQHPMAMVLSCIDSRVPVERVFDVGVGDVFVSRVAGNVISSDVLASIEFAVCVAGAKLIVIMGHTGCGAIQAACEIDGDGHLKPLLAKIRPAVVATKQLLGPPHSNEEFYNQVTRKNVRLSIEALMAKSPKLKEAISNQQVGLVGALYDVKTGRVAFEPLNEAEKTLTTEASA